MCAPADPSLLHPFEDIIDGYFPLKISLQQMLDQLDAHCAFVDITHAPIMHVPGLSHDAPVPLTIRTGRAGMIDHLRLRVLRQKNDVALSGSGVWRWLDGADPQRNLDPMTRLAEPAFLRGCFTHRSVGDEAGRSLVDAWSKQYLTTDTSGRANLGKIVFDARSYRPIVEHP